MVAAIASNASDFINMISSNLKSSTNAIESVTEIEDFDEMLSDIAEEFVDDLQNDNKLKYNSASQEFGPPAGLQIEGLDETMDLSDNSGQQAASDDQIESGGNGGEKGGGEDKDEEYDEKDLNKDGIVTNAEREAYYGITDGSESSSEIEDLLIMI